MTQGRQLAKHLRGLLQPATVCAILLFWGLAPEALVDNPLSALVASIGTMALIQSLEWVNERHEGWRINQRELFTDIFYVTLGFTVIDFLESHLAEDPLRAMKAAAGLSTPWLAHLPFVAQVAIILFLIEFGQYWMHRAMHNSFLWWPHAPHHHLTQLNAMKGAVGNPLELFLISLSVVAMFDFSLAAIYCAGTIVIAVSCFAHANIRFDPPRWYAFFFTTIEPHSLHHSVTYEETRCNYANVLIVIDRMFGTFRAGEALLVGQDDRRRLSIREQMVFPFRPLIAALNASGKGPTQPDRTPDATGATTRP